MQLQSGLHLAAEGGHLEVAEVLIKRGLDVNGGSVFARPLYYAARNGHQKLVQLLQREGALTADEIVS